MSENKGCPWCGETDPSVEHGSTFRWRVAVCGCGAQAPEVRHDTVAEQTQAEAISTARAMAQWNDRYTQWRLIDDTAKDGTCILVWSSSRGCLRAFWADVQDDLLGGRHADAFVMDGSLDRVTDATHYMPLPKGPNDE